MVECRERKMCKRIKAPHVTIFSKVKKEPATWSGQETTHRQVGAEL